MSEIPWSELYYVMPSFEVPKEATREWRYPDGRDHRIAGAPTSRRLDALLDMAERHASAVEFKGDMYVELLIAGNPAPVVAGPAVVAVRFPSAFRGVELA